MTYEEASAVLKKNGFSGLLRNIRTKEIKDARFLIGFQDVYEINEFYFSIMLREASACTYSAIIKESNAEIFNNKLEEILKQVTPILETFNASMEKAFSFLQGTNSVNHWS